MIITRTDFKAILNDLSAPGEYGLDTETTGLTQKDRLFSIILSDETQGYYFNFNHEPDHLGGKPDDEFILPKAWLADLAPVLENKDSLFFLHNAKFDLRMLAKEGLSVLGTLHDTEVMERVLKNNYLGNKPYSLKSVAPRYGYEKDESVEAYLKEHKLITKMRIPGKDKLVDLKHFDKVPFDIISPYGTVDAVITRAIGLKQKDLLENCDIYKNEKKLIKTCFKMERAGIRINRDYTVRAMEYTQLEVVKAMRHFRELTGVEFEDSEKVFKPVFLKAGIELPLTKTGRPSTRKEVLDELDNPIADAIRRIRNQQKMISTYYSSFLYFADENDLIHPNMRQGGTETLRFSYSDPNLQNVPKEDEEEDRNKPFIVRKCFEPINPDFVFVPIDFKQMEYRMLADYADEFSLIDAIMDGEDVHDATARLMGVTRKQAKTLNFGLLYGMGAPKLAKALGISLSDAYELKALYFHKLPGVKRCVRQIMSNGEKKGYVTNWFGFRSHISSPDYAYVLPNHIIQGGCAQVVRLAMVHIDKYITQYRLRSQMLLQVHDELLFQVYRTEIEHIQAFQHIMEGVYRPFNAKMKLECSVEHSWQSWGKVDMHKGVPDGGQT